MSTPLDSRPNLRRRVYAAFWAAGVALGAVQVAFASTDNGTPDALKVALAVYAFLGGAVGFVAGQNVPADDEVGDE